IRGSAAQLAWSPDGRQLAFVSMRGTHSFVGTFDINSRELRYFGASLESDQLPAWSPNSRYLAFVRVPEEAQSYRFTPRMESIPWSIQLADLRTGDVRTLWTADAGPGSTGGKPIAFAASENAVRAPLVWTHDEHVVFTWEKTGWTQLYRVGLDGRAPQQLTRSQGEVWSPSVSADGRSLYYMVNAREPERFELFRIPAEGGTPKLLSGGYGTSYVQPALPLRDGRVAFLGFNARTPSQVLVSDAGDKLKPLVSDVIPREFPTDQLVPPSVVDLQAEDGLKFRALLFKPTGLKAAQKRPAIVYVHGGSRSIATEEPNLAWGLVQALVMRGYVVLVPNFRSGIGYGLQFREAPAYGGSGGSDTLDAIASGRYLARLPEVDAKRIGIFGISYGGYLTTAALARAPDVWAAGASLVGVADWQMELELDKGGARLPFRLSERMKYEDLAHESSANAHLKGWRAPLLFISGDDDRDGWLVQAIQLGQSLRRKGIEVEAMVEPGGAHSPATHRQLRSRASRLFDFFDRRLQQ
ncbi:S9 family peptidase, partial [Steroidobacter sp.]|uniref:S9 family peptidase n=1 Tax=Steroidobacter sp. TaxID=1978227 RepID=UPI001A3CA293